MKKITLLISGLFVIGSVFAQKTPVEQVVSSNTVVIQCSDFHITRPLSEIAAENPVDENMIHPKAHLESKDRKKRKPHDFPYTVEKDGPAYGNDPSSIQTEMGNVANKAPIMNFAGQTVTGFRPMDPSGAVSSTHYIQAINSTTFRVYNKSTGAILTTATVGSLWTPATPNDGDPIIMYDKAADRWFISQFGNTGNSIYIAISQTNNPLGSYYTYTFSSPQFPDYLKFGVWTDGYYMTSNQAQKVFAFERTAMLAGTPGARAVYTSFSPPQGSGFFVPMPGDASDGVLPPAGTPCPIFSYSDNGWGAGFTDAVNIYKMAVNWSPTTPTATITSAGTVPTAAFDASYSPSWDDISQPGTTQKLDGIGGIVLYRAQWKSWTGYNTVCLTWAVRISATQRSLKWCELRQNQSTGVWSLYQEGIYTPDAATRWMGGIAMDNNGAIALCYMKSDATSIYPGLYYSGRRPCDPIGTLPVTESVAIAGTGSQTGGVNRDGDYSQVVLDPDGITFWCTSEYMGGTTGSNAARTRIYSFQLPTCGPAAPVANFTASNTAPCIGSTVNFTDISTNTPTSWAWTFSPTSVTYVGGTSSTSQHPQVQFSTVGPYTVTLVATNASGSDSEVKTSYIVPVGGGALPLVENFEGATFPPTGWTVVNADAPSIAWGTAGAKGLVRRAAAGNTGSATGSAGIECFNYNTDTTQVDNLISSPVSLVGATSPRMTFKRAYKNYVDGTNPTNYRDELRVYISTDCGATYGSAVYYKKGAQLASNGSLNTTFTPAVAADWDTDTINLTSYVGQNIIVKFEVTNRYGNNLYLDDININNTAGSVASVSISSSDTDNTICAGSSVTFTATPTNGGTAPTYQWQVNGSNVGTNSPTYTTTALTNGQVVTCIMTSNLAGVTGSPATSNSITMTVNPIPGTPSATVTSPVCTGATINLSTPAVTGATYAWTGPAAFTSAIRNPSRTNATTAMAGTYSVTITVNGCTSAAGTATVIVNTSPVVIAESNLTYCAGAAVPANTFASTPSGATYTWTNSNTAIGLAASGTTSTPAFTATNATTSPITATITITPTLSGCTGSTSTYTITVNPLPTVNAESNLTYCAGASVPANTFTSTPSGATFAWTNSNTAIGLAASGTTSTPAFTATNTTASPITATITVTPTQSGCTGTPTTFTITVNPLPASTFTQSANQCLPGNSFNFTNTGSSGAGYTYAWNFGGGGASPATSTTNNQTNVVYATPGTYTVTHTITSSGGCASTTTSSVVVYAMPNITVNSPTICPGQTAALTANGGSTYTWSAGATSSGTNTANASPASTTTYTVTGTDANSCSGTAVSTVTVGSSLSISVNSPTICAGQTATLTATGGTTYTWSAGATASGTNTATVSPTTTTSYTVTGTTSGCSGSSVSTVTVNPTPATPTITQSGLVLTSSSATGNQWYLNGTAIPGATGQNYTLTANGNYTVVVTIGGCSSASSAVQTVTGVGIEELTNNPYNLSIYPNPNDGNFTISFTSADKDAYRVEIVNSLGQLIFRDEVKDFTGIYKKEMSVVEYGQGVYLISLTNSKNETVKRIIVY